MSIFSIANWKITKSAVDTGISYQHAPPSVSRKLIKIEDELTSQKHQSSNLLNIVRQKFLTKGANDIAREYDGKNDVHEIVPGTRQKNFEDSKRPPRAESDWGKGLEKSTGNFGKSSQG
ncbi:unnamed protein product, partial [Allacma fusca]